MFLTERELKETFWENYNYKGRAVKYQFGAPIREGAADLITIEKYQSDYQINSFEFKLSDIKKALLQAKANSAFVNKSWIVIPDEKAQLIKERYESYLKEQKYVGVITVAEGGRWTMIHRPYFRNEILLNKTLVNMIMGKAY